MSHTIIYNSEARVIELKFQGDLTLNEAKETVSELAQIAKEQNCFLVFSDFREATVKLSTLEIYELPKIISDILAPLGFHVFKFKRAFIVAKDLKDFHFFETVTFNQGQNAKLFQDVDEARKWLSEK